MAELTFYLRDDAHWSNGEKVTAGDFVRSWERTIKIGPLSPHTELLSNIIGAVAPTDVRQKASRDQGSVRREQPATVQRRYCVEAVSDGILRVQLEHGDMNFPSLVAHPVFRPVKIAASDLTND